MKTILYNPIFINPQAYYVFPRLTRWLQPDEESVLEPANYIGSIEVKIIAYGDFEIGYTRNFVNTSEIDFSDFRNSYVRISLFTPLGSVVLGEWKIGDLESTTIDPAVLESLKAVVICDGKTNEDSDRAVLRNLVDKDNSFVASNFAWTEDSGYNTTTFDGALVFDGVDDMVISTKTIQEMVGDTQACTAVSMVANYGTFDALVNGCQSNVGGYNIRNEIKPTGVTCIAGYTDSKGTVKNINTILGDKNDIVVIDKVNYNTDEPFTVCFSTISYKIAWYWTIIANKVLTTDEIHQVIAYYNLDKHVKPDIYYDVKKQGLTNENHVQFNDKLIDYSGNGYDMQLYNIGWNSSSGIGGYLDVFNNFSPNGLATKINDYKCHVDATGYLGTMFLGTHQTAKAAKSIPSFKVKISDVSGGGGRVDPGITYSYVDANGNEVETTLMTDGIYALPESHVELIDDVWVGFNISYESIATIEELPENEGSLVLDGVDDYGKITGVPVYKDYTVVGEMTVPSGNASTYVASKAKTSSDGAFIWNPKSTTYSFGTASDSDTGVSAGMSFKYQTKYFNSGKAISAGSASDSDIMWLGTVRDNDSQFADIAINSLMTFPYSLDEFLIERQLKRHKLGTLHPDLIEFRPIVKADGVLNKIIYYVGNTRLNPGDYIAKNTIIKMVVYSNGQEDEFNKIKVSGKEVTYTLGTTSDGLRTATVDNITYTKSPLKIEVSIDNYIRFEDIQQPYPIIFYFADRDGKEYAFGDKIKYGTILNISTNDNLLNELYEINAYTYDKVVYSYMQLDSKDYIVGKDSLKFSSTSSYKLTNEPNVIASPQKLRLPNISYKRLGYIPDISGHGNNIKLYNSGYSGMSGANGYGIDLTLATVSNPNNGKIINKGEDYIEYQVTNISPYFVYFKVNANSTFVLCADVSLSLRYTDEDTNLLVISANTKTTVVCPKAGTLQLIGRVNPQIGDIITIQQVGLYDGAFCFDGVNDYGIIDKSIISKQQFIKLNRFTDKNASIIDNRTANIKNSYIISSQSSKAYVNFPTYIDGILNENVLTAELNGVTHNAIIQNTNNVAAPVTLMASYDRYDYLNAAMYAYASFPEISDESEIIRFNEIMGIEGKYVEKPNYYWDAYGKKNTDADKDTIIDQVTKLPANALNLKNVGYEGMSGYDGYPVIFGSNKTFRYYSSSSPNIFVYTGDNNKITFTQIYAGRGFLYSYLKQSNALTEWNKDYPSFRIRVTGTDSSKFKLVYYYLASANAISVANYPMDSDGVYTLPKSFASDGSLTASDVYVGIVFRPIDSQGIVSDVNITLEILPDYENGLALDGVNDYLENTTLPAVMDFTFITKRKNLLTTYEDGTMYIMKGLENNKWALLGDYWSGGKNTQYSFSQTNIVTPFDLIGFITPTSYNGTAITKGTTEDSQGMHVGGWSKYWKGVFYNLMLFDRTINMLSINMIKNLMNKDGIVDLSNPVFKNN